MIFKSRKSNKATQVDTLIGQHTEVLGDVQFSGGLHIDGTVKGGVTAEDDARSMLSLSESGTIEGDVRVSYVVANGTIVGDLYSGEHVEIAAKARITGNVYYNLIEMAKGAEVNGKLIHTSEADQGQPPTIYDDISHITE